MGFGVKFGFVNLGCFVWRSLWEVVNFLGNLDLNLGNFVNFGCLAWNFEW